MIGNYLRLPEAELRPILREPASITKLLYLEDEADFREDAHLDLGKAWHLIHFLLAGKLWEGSEPLGNAVMGGTEIGDEDVGYGPARYLTPMQVREVADALASISSDQLWSRFDARAVWDADIYPSGWEGTDVERDYVVNYFGDLKAFFRRAAKQNEAVVLYIN